MIASHGRAQYAYINRFSHRNNKSKMSSAIMIYICIPMIICNIFANSQKNYPYICVFIFPELNQFTRHEIYALSHCKKERNNSRAPISIQPFIQQKNNKNSFVQHQMDQITLYGYFCAFQLKVKEEGKRIAAKKNYLCT